MKATELWKIKEEVYADIEIELSKMKVSEQEKNRIQLSSIEAIEGFFLNTLIHLLDSKE